MTTKENPNKVKNSPLVTVIVPVYNCEKLIERCVDSIITQTYKNIEIILVNDGSTDNSLDVCNKIKNKDERIIVYNKENGGASSARNHGVNNSNGSFIQFVDADDYIEKEMITVMTKEIEDNDLIVCGYRYINNGKEIGHQSSSELVFAFNSEIDNFLEFLNKHMFCPVNKLYKRELIVSFNEKHKFGEDFIFNLNYLYNCENIKFIPNIFYNYNVDTPNSLTKSNKDKYLDLFKVIFEELIIFNSKKLKNKYGTDYIYDYIYEHLNMIIINKVIFQKINSRIFLKNFLKDEFVKNIINNVNYFNKPFLQKIKLLLLKKKLITIYITLVKFRKKIYLKNFIN